jgi:hypothetical protein
MQVWMKKQILSPGVQDGEEPEACPKMFGIGSNGQQSFSAGAEQNL